MFIKKKKRQKLKKKIRVLVKVKFLRIKFNMQIKQVSGSVVSRSLNLENAWVSL